MSPGVVLVLAALLVFGATRLRNMPVDALPEFSPPTAEVQTEALGLSSRELTPIEVSVLGPLDDPATPDGRARGGQRVQLGGSASARSALGLSIQSSRELRVPACSVS